jgi:hypothetical protein
VFILVSFAFFYPVTTTHHSPVDALARSRAARVRRSRPHIFFVFFDLLFRLFPTPAKLKSSPAARTWGRFDGV